MALLTRPDVRDKLREGFQDFLNALEKTPIQYVRNNLEELYFERIVDEMLDIQTFGYLQGVKDARKHTQ